MTRKKPQIQDLDKSQIDKVTMIIKDLYESFYKLVTGYQDYRFVPNKRELKMIENFILSVHYQFNIYSIGIDFLLTYFIYTFDRWQDKKTRFKAHIPLEWIIGKKALNTWQGRNVELMAYINDVNFVRKYNIDLVQIRNKYHPPEVIDFQLVIRVENNYRNIYYNTIKGLQMCFLRTSMYTPASELCIACRNQIECRQIQKKTYPDIYKERHEQAKS